MLFKGKGVGDQVRENGGEAKVWVNYYFARNPFVQRMYESDILSVKAFGLAGGRRAVPGGGR